MDYEESSNNSIDIENKIAAFLLKKKGLDKNEPAPEYTDLKIITHVAKAQLGVNLNLNVSYLMFALWLVHQGVCLSPCLVSVSRTAQAACL